MKILFYKGTSFVDKSILFISRGGYSHCSIVLNNGSLIEAKPFKRVHRCSSIISELKSNTIIDIFDVTTTSEQDKIIEDFLISQIGKKYDYLSIIGFVLYTSESGRKAYKHWICSELVFVAFRKAGINLLERVDAWKVSPTILSYNTVMILNTTINFKP